MLSDATIATIRVALTFLQSDRRIIRPLPVEHEAIDNAIAELEALANLKRIAIEIRDRYSK